MRATLLGTVIRGTFSQTTAPHSSIRIFELRGVQFYGRRPIYLGAFTMFFIWIIPCAVAQNIQTLLIARL